MCSFQQKVDDQEVKPCRTLMSSLFVGNLSSHVRHRELENAFRRFGRSNLELKNGFGFVVYEEHRDAERALKALQGRSICGEQPYISWAKRHHPFQRFSGKGNSVRRGSWDKYQSQVNRRRPSLELDRGSDDDRREDKLLEVVKDGSRASETREDTTTSIAREEEWKDSRLETSLFEEETKDVDPLDSGRWDPHMEGSPEHIMGDGVREDEEDPLDDKDRKNDKSSLHEKSQGSPVDEHRERSSRGYRNSFDQYRRGRDATIGRPQERCYNCGQLGHVKQQCRSRPRMNNMLPRDSSYDGRRNELRYFRGCGGFRGMGGGRFRGIYGSRRVFNRDMEGNYARSHLRRRDSTGDRRHYDPVDIKSREKHRRRRHRSESPKDSLSRGRSKRKHKKSSKKSSRSTRKRRRSSSNSLSYSRSPGSSSSSSSGSQSRSRSGALSPSVAARSQSSKSRSQSSSSVSHSRPTGSQPSTSRSQAASSPSRSCLGSSYSKSESLSSQSRSPVSHDVPHLSPKSMEVGSPPSRTNSKAGSRSPKHEIDREAATSYKPATGSGQQEKQVSGRVTDEDMQEKDGGKYSSEGQDSKQQYAKRKDRKHVGSREAKKHRNNNIIDTEEPHYEMGLQSNGGKHGSTSIKSSTADHSVHQDTAVNEQYSRYSTGAGKVSLKGSESVHPDQVPDTKCSIYMAIMKEAHRGAGCHDDGQELATESFGAARLWPWEAMLYRRLKRGPISTANYEKRKAQNEEFRIKDTFVRSSSGWWEKHSE